MPDHQAKTTHFSEYTATLASMTILVFIGIIWQLIPDLPTQTKTIHSPTQEQLMMAMIEAIQPPIPEEQPQTDVPKSSTEPTIQPKPEITPQSTSIETPEPVKTPELSPIPKVQSTQTITTPKKAIHKTTTKSKPKQPKSNPTVQQTLSSEAITQTSPVTAQSTTQPIVTSSKPTASEPDVLAQYRALIINTLAKHKYYPAISRRLHEEGTTTLHFKVARSGEVSELHVISSSEIERLDNAALGIFTELNGLLPAFLPEIPEATLSFEIPIVYRLQ